MTGEQIQERVTQLRIEKGVSAHRMSFDLGLSESYINRLESGAMLPSMAIFLKICDYFKITPLQFFTVEKGRMPSREVMDACDKLAAMPERWQVHVIGIINSLMD